MSKVPRPLSFEPSVHAVPGRLSNTQTELFDARVHGTFDIKNTWSPVHVGQFVSFLAKMQMPIKFHPPFSPWPILLGRREPRCDLRALRSAPPSATGIE